MIRAMTNATADHPARRLYQDGYVRLFDNQRGRQRVEGVFLI
jgi:ferric-dicitrate binding protein FerR (iron transport regulator)